MTDASASSSPRTPAKVVGIGLNKTGTKTLRTMLTAWGYRNRTYDSNTTTESPSFDLLQAGNIEQLIRLMDEYDSFEDWPWPLLYREIDQRYPDARFILTTRKDADTWYRSLCNMAVRIGPFPLFEKHVYGAAMPQGHRQQYVACYQQHNAQVREYFRDRPGKLLEVCWELGDGVPEVAAFLGTDASAVQPSHANRSPRRVYSGDNLWRAHFHRIIYQQFRTPGTLGYRIVRAFRHRVLGRR